MAQSEGFNPRPKVVFTLALALGIEGHREVLELELAEPWEPEEVLRKLAEQAPPGLVFLEAEAVPIGRAAQAASVEYTLDVPAARQDAARTALAEFLASDCWPYTRHRPDRTVELDLRPFVLDAAVLPQGVLRFRMRIAPNGSARAEEVVDALGLRDLLGQGSVLARTKVELALPEHRPGSPDSRHGSIGPIAVTAP